MLLDSESLLGFLKGCVREPGSHDAQAEQMQRLFRDVAKIIHELEQVQRGGW